MVTLENAVVARIEKSGKHFEILVDPDMAYNMKEGKSVSIQNMLAVNQIFTEASKGDKVSESDLEVFETNDIYKIAEEIIRNGEIQLTTEYRKKKIAEKRKEISYLISKNSVNPQTKLPHPQERIENAMDGSKINIDPFRKAESQMGDVIDAIKQVIPISVDSTDVSVSISAAYASRAYGIIKAHEIKSEEWGQDGSLSVVISLQPGSKNEFFRKINDATEKSAQISEV